MSMNDEPKIAHAPVNINDAPTKGSAPAPPANPSHGSLPGSSVPIAELEKGAADGLLSKGLPPETDPK